MGWDQISRAGSRQEIQGIRTGHDFPVSFIIHVAACCLPNFPSRFIISFRYLFSAAIPLSAAAAACCMSSCSVFVCQFVLLLRALCMYRVPAGLPPLGAAPSNLQLRHRGYLIKKKQFKPFCEQSEHHFSRKTGLKNR